ncbi:DUF2203 domain-containing protein [Paenibacillus sp. IB182496]|uniref:DUF2203 domain-containing protein n=1 Tax=Paenibacillus sabuli TaxID=2772509 RepID=A0A927BWE3_9BACL|nr:DUF2203 domain-containing protein [Paenibacillus sabuli]MBD2846699.1 DUF2203 domain-containing protein [Paenibacillus sabuli]
MTKHFTLTEANRLLPELQRDLKELQELAREMERQMRELKLRKAKQQPSVSGQSADLEPDSFFEQEGRIEFMQLEAEMKVANFARKGVMLKMLDPGLIDFPSELNGQEVLICWKEGEEAATHYHSWRDGYAGRQRHPEAGED